MKTVGMYLAELLAAYGVEVIFGIPGVHTVELYRGLPKTGIRHITPRHEQGAGFMADGYARAGGKPGVCFVISGPGLTNIATAMAQAYADSIPMLVISSVNALGQIGSGEGWLHELQDQRQLVRQVAGFSHTVTRPEELAKVVARAFALFSGARPRPVHIELPLDVITASAEHLPAPARAALPVPPGPSAAAIGEAARILNGAKAPLLLLGGGAADCDPFARNLAEKLDAPAVMTVNGRGLLPPEHPLAVPCSPSMAPVMALIEAADVVLAVGTEFGPTDYDFYEAGRAKFRGQSIRIDIDAQQLLRGQPTDLPIIADASEGLTALLPLVQESRRGGAERAAAARDGVLKGLSHPYRACLPSAGPGPRRPCPMPSSSAIPPSRSMRAASISPRRGRGPGSAPPRAMGRWAMRFPPPSAPSSPQGIAPWSVSRATAASSSLCRSWARPGRSRRR